MEASCLSKYCHCEESTGDEAIWEGRNDLGVTYAHLNVATQIAALRSQ